MVCSFINRISGAHQMDEPPEFYGGIIADPMGLGKTLTMIALIATDIEVINSRSNDNASGVHGESSSGQTLVIVPPPRKDPTASPSRRSKELTNTLSVGYMGRAAKAVWLLGPLGDTNCRSIS